MFRDAARSVALYLVAAVAVALPTMADFIPAGEDRWVTPGNGNTFFTFPIGEVESLCGADTDFDWNRTVALEGNPEPGYDWDTAIARLDSIDVSFGSVSVPIQVQYMTLRSIDFHETPCGPIYWEVRSLKHQPVTKMRIHNTSGEGGQLESKVSVQVAFEAIHFDGAVLGLLFYTIELHNSRSIGWSFDEFGTFRPGIDADGRCFQTLRKGGGDLPAQHSYHIEDAIAEGRCTQEPEDERATEE